MFFAAVVSVTFSEADLVATNVPYALFLPMAPLYTISLITTLSSRAEIAKQTVTSSGFRSTNLNNHELGAVVPRSTPAGLPGAILVSRIEVRLVEGEEDQAEKGWPGGAQGLRAV